MRSSYIVIKMETKNMMKESHILIISGDIEIL